MIRNILVCWLTLGVTLSAQAQESFSLEEAIAYALNNSNAIAQKRIEIADAVQNVKELRAIGLPKVSAGVDYSYYLATPQQPLQDFISPIVIQTLNQTGIADPQIPLPEPTFFEASFFQKNNLTASLDATMLVFDGSYLAALEAAKLFQDMSNEGMEVTEQAIRSNVTRAYLNVLIIDINRETIKKNVSNLEQSIFELGEMYKSGFIEKLDVDRLEVSLLNLNTELEKLNELEALSENMLKFQMDYPLEKDIVLSEELDILLDQIMIEEVDLDKEIDYTKKAEYQQIQMGLELNALNVKRFERGYLPSLVLFGNLSETLARNKLFNKDETGFLLSSAVGLSMNVPIFDGFEKKAQIQRAKLNLEKRQIDFENFEKAVAFQIYNARMQYSTARRSVETRKRTLDLTQDIYDKTLIKFREGVGSSIEVTQAESALYESQSNYINSLYELLTAKTELEIALGEI